MTISKKINRHLMSLSVNSKQNILLIFYIGILGIGSNYPCNTAYKENPNVYKLILERLTREPLIDTLLSHQNLRMNRKTFQVFDSLHYGVGIQYAYNIYLKVKSNNIDNIKDSLFIDDIKDFSREELARKNYQITKNKTNIYDSILTLIADDENSPLLVYFYKATPNVYTGHIVIKKQGVPISNLVEQYSYSQFIKFMTAIRNDTIAAYKSGLWQSD